MEMHYINTLLHILLNPSTVIQRYKRRDVLELELGDRFYHFFEERRIRSLI